MKVFVFFLTVGVGQGDRLIVSGPPGFFEMVYSTSRKKAFFDLIVNSNGDSLRSQMSGSYHLERFLSRIAGCMLTQRILFRLRLCRLR